MNTGSKMEDTRLGAGIKVIPATTLSGLLKPIECLVPFTLIPRILNRLKFLSGRVGNLGAEAFKLIQYRQLNIKSGGCTTVFAGVDYRSGVSRAYIFRLFFLIREAKNGARSP